MKKPFYKLTPKTTSYLGVGFFSLLGRVVSFCSLPFISKVYSLSEFGDYATLSVFAAFMQAISTLRIEDKIFLAQSDMNLPTLRGLAIQNIFVITIILGLPILLLMASLLSLDFGYIYFVLPLMIVTGINRVLGSEGVRQQKYTLITISILIQIVCQYPMQLLLGHLGYKTFGLLAGELFGGVMAMVYMRMVLMNQKVDQGIIWLLPRKQLQLIRKHYQLSFFGSFSHIFAQLCFGAPQFLMHSLYGAPSAGMYGIAHKFMNVPVSVFSFNFSKVFAIDFSKELRDGRVVLPLMRRSIKVAVASSLGIYSAIFLVLPWVVSMFLDKEWQHSIDFMYAMFPLYIISFILGPFGQTLIYLGREKTSVKWEVGQLIVLFAIAGIVYNIKPDRISFVLYTALALALYKTMFLCGILRKAAAHDKLISSSTRQDDPNRFKENLSV